MVAKARSCGGVEAARPSDLVLLAALAMVALLGAVASSGCSRGCDGGCGTDSKGVVLVIVDTVRADHLSCYGYERDTSPSIDRIAAEGELYWDAWAQSPWTLPSVASILTGMLPQEHGAGRAPGGGFFPVGEKVRGLAERLSAAGWATGAVVNVEFLSPGGGLERGFDFYDYRPSAASDQPARDARQTTLDALAWVRTVRDGPFFLLVHYFDPHLPYTPPAELAERYEPPGSDRAPPDFGRDIRTVEAIRDGIVTPSKARQQSIVARYDAEIRFMDDQVGVLQQGLSELGLWDRSLFVLVADHGEEFWDHGGFEHGHTHYREQLRVPLVVRRPGGEPVKATGRVRQIDLAPAILRFAGVESTDGLSGLPLGPGVDEDAVALGTLWAGSLASIRANEGTLIVNLDSGARQLYAPEDLVERRDLFSARPEGAAALEERLRDTVERGGSGAGAKTWPMSPELADQLRALGYIASDGGPAPGPDVGPAALPDAAAP